MSSQPQRRKATHYWSVAPVSVSAVTAVVMSWTGYNFNYGMNVEGITRIIVAVVTALPAAASFLVQFVFAVWLALVVDWRARLALIALLTGTAALALYATLWLYQDVPDAGLDRVLLSAAFIGPLIPVWVAFLRELRRQPKGTLPANGDFA